jgi:hypothetical protein
MYVFPKKNIKNIILGCFMLGAMDCLILEFAGIKV